jgi:hypothetical protein
LLSSALISTAAYIGAVDNKNVEPPPLPLSSENDRGSHHSFPLRMLGEEVRGEQSFSSQRGWASQIWRSLLRAVFGSLMDLELLRKSCELWRCNLLLLKSFIGSRKQLTTFGIDETLLAVYRRLAMQNERWDGELPYSFTGYTHAIIDGGDGETISYNAHPCYHGAAWYWYDWAYVQYDIDGDQKFYPLRVLGFTKSGTDSINAIIQYSMEDVTWDRLQEDFVVPFHLCTEASKEDIVPLTSLCHPICVDSTEGGMESKL